MVPVSFVRLLGPALIVIGVLELITGVGEIYVSHQAIGFGVADTSGGERWLVFSAYVRALSDGLWTIGFGGVVAAAGVYLAREEKA